MKNENHEKQIEIIVNGRPKVVEKQKLSYREVIELAFGQFDENPNAAYTVTYSKGKHVDKGSLVDGQEIMVQKEMVFNVTRTDKS
jgi:hypothetical protein